MRIEALRAFVTVAECGNIADAAERLHRTPSAISMTLKQVETQLGAPLFETDRKSNLTALGERVRQIALGLLREHDRALAQIHAVASGRLGTLQMAAVPSVAAQILPAVIEAFLARSPEVRLELIDTDSAAVRDLVASGAVELGVAGPPRATPDLEFRPLFHDAFVLVCRSDHPLAGAVAPLPWSALQGQRLIANEAARDIAAGAGGLAARPSVVSARNVISLQALVLAGVGVTLLPALATAALPEGLRAVPLADPRARRTVGLITRAGRAASPVAAHFAGVLRGWIETAGPGLSLDRA